ncbi:keratin, type I cytoskeletal 9 [Nilaparvata lugens]|uniref:keratin, type I cytoskeletal 9 n=1 Tax=Nilaparvata lugens TaxID=108931 RepID=UPI00193E57BF|nr:keratin, type I cytoskeletal 9 [Nilaparvata lugens]
MHTFALNVAIFAAALLSAVQSQPFPGVSTAGSSANAGAFSSSGTALRPGPDGTGSFVAQSGFNHDFSNPSFRSASSGSSSPSGYSGGFAGGSYSGGSFGGGSGGSFGSFGTSGYPFPNFAPVPFPYFAPAQPFDFSSFFQNYIASIQRYHQQLAASAQKAAADQGGLAPQLPQSPDSFGNELGTVAGAGAFGQYGPQGGYGQASVFPAPSPDVFNRFGGSPPVSQSSGPFPPPGGSYYGISSFSSSGQSDVNGKKSSFKQSSVTVNDNGKVTTYQAHDP